MNFRKVIKKIQSVSLPNKAFINFQISQQSVVELNERFSRRSTSRPKSWVP